jgi:hypothetical protein
MALTTTNDGTITLGSITPSDAMLATGSKIKGVPLFTSAALQTSALLFLAALKKKNFQMRSSAPRQ